MLPYMNGLRNAEKIRRESNEKDDQIKGKVRNQEGNYASNKSGSTYVHIQMNNGASPKYISDDSHFLSSAYSSCYSSRVTPS